MCSRRSLAGTEALPRRGARRRAGRAFTLLEMLVALAVFAAIGVMATRILAGMVDIAENTRSRADAFSDLQRALAIVQRDVEQLAHRPVRDELGDELGAATLGDGSLLELTRHGWQNPLAAARSEMQRVAYVVERDRLVRLFWEVLDRAPTSEAHVQTLLEDVRDVEFIAHDDNGETHRFWPRMNDDGSRQLAAIAIDLEVENYGRIERLWLVPQAMASPEDEQDDDDLDEDDLDEADPVDPRDDLAPPPGQAEDDA